jgi:CelD/BcsL family acetyltransferase involved in cellulose biosynthesis
LAGPVEFRREALPPLAVLEGQWRRLEATAPVSFFTSWHWIGTLLALLPEASQPSLLRGSIGGETIALALLGASLERRRHGLIRSRALYLNETGDPDVDALTIEHNGLVASANHEAVAVDALIAWFAENARDVDELHIRGGLRRVPEGVVEAHGLRKSEVMVPSYCVELCRISPSGGELFSVLSANARQQLRRALRYFERYGPLQLRQAATITEAYAFFGALKELHSVSWERRGKRHAFSGAFFEPFHRLLIERSFAAGAIELLRVSAGTRVIGYLYNFRKGDHVYAYQSGFAYDEPAARPGAVAHAMAIREAYRSGAAFYDFLAGRNRLKESYSTRCEPMLWQVIQQPRLAFRLEDLARSVKQRIESVQITHSRRKKALQRQR